MSKMKSVSVFTLKGKALDWAVAKTQGKFVDPWHAALSLWLGDHRYSKDFSLGMPIIEQGEMNFTFIEADKAYRASNEKGGAVGASYLEAGLRCHVYGMYGPVIEVPEVLAPDIPESRAALKQPEQLHVGRVIALPGVGGLECDEIMETLRNGGTTAVLVSGRVARDALAEADRLIHLEAPLDVEPN